MDPLVSTCTVRFRIAQNKARLLLILWKLRGTAQECCHFSHDDKSVEIVSFPEEPQRASKGSPSSRSGWSSTDDLMEQLMFCNIIPLVCSACDTQSHTPYSSLSPEPSLWSPVRKVIESFIAAHSTAVLWNESIHLNCHSEFWTAGQTCWQSHSSPLLELAPQILSGAGKHSPLLSSTSCSLPHTQATVGPYKHCNSCRKA